MEALRQLDPVYCQEDRCNFGPDPIVVDDVLRTGDPDVITCPGGKLFYVFRQERPMGQPGPRYDIVFTCTQGCKQIGVRR